MKNWLLFFALYLALIGVACSEKSKTDVVSDPASPSAPENAPKDQEEEQGFFEDTGRKVDKGIKKSGEKINQGLEKAGEKIEEGFDRAGEKIKDASD